MALFAAKDGVRGGRAADELQMSATPLADRIIE